MLFRSPAQQAQGRDQQPGLHPSQGGEPSRTPSRRVTPSTKRKADSGSRSAGCKKQRMSAPGSEGVADPRLTEKKLVKSWAESCGGWCDAIGLAGKKFFNGIQFLVSKRDEEFGSPWQVIVCDTIAVPEEDQEEFWYRSGEGGRAKARKTLNTRRTNVTNAIKAKFFSTFAFAGAVPEVLISLILAPFSIIPTLQDCLN